MSRDYKPLALQDNILFYASFKITGLEFNIRIFHTKKNYWIFECIV